MHVRSAYVEGTQLIGAVCCTTESGAHTMAKRLFFFFFVSFQRRINVVRRLRVVVWLFAKFSSVSRRPNWPATVFRRGTQVQCALFWNDRQLFCRLVCCVVSRFTCIRIIYRDKNIYPLTVSRQTKGGKLSRWFRVKGFFLFNSTTRVHSRVRLRLYEHGR